jgi:hypothetical protein
MRETRSSGSVRGASGDGRPYRERVSPVPVFPGEGPFTERPADAQRGGANRYRVRSACQEL